MNPDNQPYSDSQISWAEQRLGLWLKVGSTTSDQAYHPIDLLKCWNYWRKVYLLGVRGKDTDYIIDIDEAKFKLEPQDHKRGKVTRQRQCDARGRYKKGAGGINLIMGWWVAMAVGVVVAVAVVVASVDAASPAVASSCQRHGEGGFLPSFGQWQGRV
jgi:hypothetical protein